MSFSKNRYPLDIQLNFADPLDIHLKYRRDPLNIRYIPYTDLENFKPLGCPFLKIPDHLDFRYPPHAEPQDILVLKIPDHLDTENLIAYSGKEVSYERQVIGQRVADDL